jgi:hypothetical protein
LPHLSNDSDAGQHVHAVQLLPTICAAAASAATAAGAPMHHARLLFAAAKFKGIGKFLHI